MRSATLYRRYRRTGKTQRVNRKATMTNFLPETEFRVTMKKVYLQIHSVSHEYRRTATPPPTDLTRGIEMSIFHGAGKLYNEDYARL